MKIALLGAPGSGKSKFAKKLARNLAKDGDKPTIIDGYVEDLQVKTGQAYDYSANYAENLQIFFHRRTLEQEATFKGSDSITCGTMYESIVYAAIHGLTLPGDVDPVETVKTKITFSMLGQLQFELYDYEAMFYLPLSQEVIDSKGASYDLVVDQKIGEILESYNKECVILDGTDRENAKYASEIIRAIRTHQSEPSEDEQPAVRGSGEDDQGLTEEAERVSNVWSNEGGGSAGS